jgi:guanosine-3',5'-bis(diphosphate) 3'-pyrophosphohydrolase
MLLVKALNFAAEKHKGQERRGTKLPYVIHPIIVSHLIAKYKSTSKHLEELQIAALLHDVLEDTDTTFFEIEREFGSLVASLTQELTSDPIMVTELGKNEYLKQKMLKMSKYAFVLKLVDRYSNILDKPGEAYVKKTINMMTFLLKNREDITERQKLIISDIISACEELS